MDDEASNLRSVKDEQMSSGAHAQHDAARSLEQESLTDVVGRAGAFDGLPMETLISGPLVAAATAGAMLGSPYYENLSRPKVR